MHKQKLTEVGSRNNEGRGAERPAAPSEQRVTQVPFPPPPPPPRGKETTKNLTRFKPTILILLSSVKDPMIGNLTVTVKCYFSTINLHSGTVSNLLQLLKLLLQVREYKYKVKEILPHCCNAKLPRGCRFLVPRKCASFINGDHVTTPGQFTAVCCCGWLCSQGGQG